MECIICQDTGTEELQDNDICACKYKVHNSCLTDYTRHVSIVTCLMCRKERVAPGTTTTIIQEPVIQEPIIQEPIIQEPIIQEPNIVRQDIVIVINQPNLVEEGRRNSSALICPIGACLSLVILALVLIWK
jgi:hypothetical protein